MSKIVFVKNSEDVLSQNFEVFKAKPMDRNEEGVQINTVADGDVDEILLRKN